MTKIKCSYHFCSISSSMSFLLIDSMPYIFKEKFKIADLAPLAGLEKKILLLDADESLLNIYGALMAGKNFEILACRSLPEVDGLARRHRPAALVCNLDMFASPAPFVRLLARLRRRAPEIKCITHALQLELGDLSELMSAGVFSHIERKLTRPADLAAVVKTAFASR